MRKNFWHGNITGQHNVSGKLGRWFELHSQALPLKKNHKTIHISLPPNRQDAIFEQITMSLLWHHVQQRNSSWSLLNMYTNKSSKIFKNTISIQYSTKKLYPTFTPRLHSKKQVSNYYGDGLNNEDEFEKKTWWTKKSFINPQQNNNKEKQEQIN